MNPLRLISPVLIASVLLSGCASTANFSHTPTASAEFSKDLMQLKREYSDIEKYERFFVSPEDSPAVDDLSQAWGKPAVKKQWGMFALGLGVDAAVISAGYLSAPVVGVLFFLSPAPNEEYVWEKGRYTITAQGHTGAMTRFEKRIVRWNWVEKPLPDDVAMSVMQGR